MEKIKNNEIGIGGIVIFSIIVGFLAYDAGETSGLRKAKLTFLDSAYISSCNDKGDYCNLNTNDGDKEIACSDNNKCLITPSTLEEIKRQKEFSEIIKKSLPTGEEVKAAIKKYENEK